MQQVHAGVGMGVSTSHVYMSSQSYRATAGSSHAAVNATDGLEHSMCSCTAQRYARGPAQGASEGAWGVPVTQPRAQLHARDKSPIYYCTVLYGM